MPAIKIPEQIKRAPKIVWVVVAGVVLAIIYLRMKGTGASASAGLSGGGGGGGESSTQAGGTAPSDTTTVGAPPGSNPLPGGTQSPLEGLPGGFFDSSQSQTPVPSLPGLTPRLAGVDQGTTADTVYNLTGPEWNAIFGGQSGVNLPAESLAVGAAAPTPGGPGSADYINQLYDRLKVFANAYSGKYTGPTEVSGTKNLADALQITQQQIYNYINAGQLEQGVPIPFNQFLANEGVYVTGSDAVKKLLAGAAPKGSPTSNDLGVYQPNADTSGYIKSISGNNPTGSGIPGSPSISTGETTGGIRIPTTAEMLAAIKARSPGATTAQIQKTLTNDLAKGYTPAQIVK